MRENHTHQTSGWWLLLQRGTGRDLGTLPISLIFSFFSSFSHPPFLPPFFLFFLSFLDRSCCRRTDILFGSGGLFCWDGVWFGLSQCVCVHVLDNQWVFNKHMVTDAWCTNFLHSSRMSSQGGLTLVKEGSAMWAVSYTQNCERRPHQRGTVGDGFWRLGRNSLSGFLSLSAPSELSLLLGNASYNLTISGLCCLKK